MVVVADKFIEFVHIRFGSFDVEVLGSKVFGKGSLKEGWWDSFNKSVISYLFQKSLWEVFLQYIPSHILILEKF